MNIFKKLFYYLRLRDAIIKAELEHSQTGKRYYVMPMLTTNGKLVIVDRHNFRGLKRKHYISENATLNDLFNESFYYTAQGNGIGRMDKVSQKRMRRYYYRWVDSVCKK